MDKVWVTKEGFKWNVSNMTDSHIVNTINYFYREYSLDLLPWEESFINPPKDRLLALYHVIKEAEARGLKFKIAKHVWETMKAGAEGYYASQNKVTSVEAWMYEVITGATS